MTNRSSKNAEPRADMLSANLFDSPLGKVVEHNRLVLEKLTHAMQEESLRFVNHRLECTGRALEGLRNCEGVTGMMAVHNEYLVGVAQDYLEGSRRFGEILRELAFSGAREATEATPLRVHREERNAA
jgi:hypothetical protein